jgi:hypothetical protein
MTEAARTLGIRTLILILSQEVYRNEVVDPPNMTSPITKSVDYTALSVAYTACFSLLGILSLHDQNRFKSLHLR